LICQRDRLLVAPYHDPDLVWSYQNAFDNDFALDFSASRNACVNTMRIQRLRGERLVTEQKVWAEIDYTRELDPDRQSDLCWTLTQRASISGFALWFEATLAGGFGFTSHPEQTSSAYSCLYLPLERTISANAGDAIELGLSAKLQRNVYLWKWTARQRNASGGLECELRHCDLLDSPLTHDRLRRQAPAFRPRATISGSIKAFVLGHMDGVLSNEAIAKALMASFPKRYPDLRAAVDEVAAIAAQYAE
jgi:hypothetical protein